MRRISTVLAATVSVPAYLLLAAPAAEAVSCNLTTSIYGDTPNDRYIVAGEMWGCSGTATMRIRCKPVHRHSFSWHSHDYAFDVTRAGVSYMYVESGWIGGTNGDTYKANCTYYINGTNVGTVESGTITL